MSFRPVLLIFVLFSLSFSPVLIWGAENVRVFEPTPFQNVRFPEISPEKQRLLEETENELKKGEISRESFEILRKFLVLEPEKFLHEESFLPLQKVDSVGSAALAWGGGAQSGPLPRQNVAGKIRSFLKSLPPETLNAWRVWVDGNVEAALNSNLELNPFPTSTQLKRFIRENPFSSYEIEFWELLAQKAWQSGNAAQAARCWEMELRLRAKQSNEWTSKTFYLPELPAIGTIQNQFQAAQKVVEISDSELKLKSNENGNENGNENVTGNETAEKKWWVSMTRIVAPSGEAIFEDLLPEDQRGTLFPNRTRNSTEENEETPQFLALTPDKNFLVARLGTRVSVWPEEERDTRPQAYLVVLDLFRGGQLVWFKPPVSVASVFIGNPLADSEFVYIPVLQIRKNAEISLAVYSLADGTLRKNVPLFLADFPEERATGMEPIFLPIRWTQEGNIQIGGFTSRVQVTVDPNSY